MASPKFVEDLESAVRCPKCGSKLRVRTNRKTTHQFLGCPGYPKCDGKADIPEAWYMKVRGQPELL